MGVVISGSVPGWLAKEYPFHPRTFQTPGGARMSYVDEGPRKSEAVLMLHGNPTWSFYYRHLVHEIVPSMRCIVPDHVGMGLSEKPQDYDYTLASRIADIEALVQSLGLTRIHLVVHDWGGAIGFGFAMRFKSARSPGPRPRTPIWDKSAPIGRIVVLNTAAFTSRHIPYRIAVCRLPRLGPIIVRGANGFARAATFMTMHRRRLTRLEKRAYLWPYDTWENRVAVDAFVRDIPRHPGDPSWSTLKEIEGALVDFQEHRSMIIWGGRDFCFNHQFHHEWRRYLPGAAVQWIDDAGHYVLEDARRETMRLIPEFLLRTGLEN